MDYTFDILGVSPILHFFNHQQTNHKKPASARLEYIGAYKCTLDVFLESVETVPREQGWNLDQVVDTVINFWLNNSEVIQYWKGRLDDAGQENLLVARIADIAALQETFESLLEQQ